MSQELFNQALLAAQQEFPPIHKGRTAKIETNKGNYSYTYADLGDILEAVLPVLHSHGIALMQPSVSLNGAVGVQTKLVHQSGHVEDCGELLLPSGNNPQAAGSAMTYARRYAACAALGIVADEDDDGRAASAPPSDYVEAPDFTDAIRQIVSEFAEWDDEQRRREWVRAASETEVGKPTTTQELGVIEARVREYYAEYLDSLT